MISRALASLFLLLCLSVSASAAGCTGTGNCFWEGGTGNWSDTTKWCTTDTNPCTGATGGLPGSGDNVNFTALSNATAYTVTVDVAANAKAMTWALPGTSGVPTFAGNQTLSLFGALTCVAGMQWTRTAGFSFNGNNIGSINFTSAGVQFGENIVLAGTGTTKVVLQDNLTIIGRTLTATGSLDTNSKTVTTANFVSTSGTRTVTLDNSTINITGTSGTPWNISAGGLTFSATGSTINVNGGTVNTTLTLTTATGLTYGTFNITAAGLVVMSGSSTYKNFSYTSTTDKRDRLTPAGGTTIAASGSLTIAGNSVVNRAFVAATTLGTQATFTVPSTATVSLTNVDFQDIAFTGTFGTVSGTSLGDCLGNSGITFDASVTLTWDTSKTGAQNWSGSNWLGTTNRVPLPQDDVILPALSVGTTLTEDMPRQGRNIDRSAFNRTFQGSSGIQTTIFGNETFGASNTFNSPTTHNYQGRGAQTITTNGKGLTTTYVVAAFGGSYTLQDGFSNTGTLTLLNGTLALGSNDLSNANFTSSGAGAHAITGSGNLIITNVAGTPFNVSGNSLTTSGFTGTIKLTGNVSLTLTFAGNSLSWPVLFWSSPTATGTLIITGANTFADIQTDPSTARTIQFPASTTQTLGAFSARGSAGHVLSLTSSIGGTKATLSKPSGLVNIDYMNITDSSAVGGAAWFAGDHSTCTNTDGWICHGPSGGGFLTVGYGQ